MCFQDVCVWVCEEFWYLLASVRKESEGFIRMSFKLERERETERERDRERERDIERQRDRVKKGERDRETKRL